MMTTGLNEGSAKIYQFPVGGRSALAGRRYGDTRATEVTMKASAADCFDSWYHQAAIQESQLGRDH